MTTKPTKADLLSQVAELTRTINMLQCVPAPPPRVVQRNIEAPLQSGCFGAVDLREVDYMRKALRSRVAHELADELIRSGAVQINERLIRNTNRYTDTVRLEASIKVAA